MQARAPAEPGPAENRSSARPHQTQSDPTKEADLTWVKCAATTMSEPRSHTASSLCNARGVRPRYGVAMTSKTTSCGAAI
jgi:hypothetical protein